MMKKAIVIINPSSGDQTAKDYHDLILKEFGKYFDEVDIRYTKKDGDAERFAKEASADKVDTVVAFGGDGTVNEAVKGIAESEYRPKLGILPGGTVNSLARVLEMPMDKEEAIKGLDFKSVREMDVGCADDNYFTLSVSIGEVSDAIHDAGINDKTELGALAYIKDALKELVDMDLNHVTMKFPDRTVEGEYSNVLVAVTNEIFGKIITEKVDSSDGKLMILGFKEINLGDLLELSANTIGKQIEESDAVDLFYADEMVLDADGNPEYDIDGDLGGRLPVKIKILPRYLKMYRYQ